MKRLASGEIAIAAWEVQESSPVQSGMVLLEVERSVVDIRQLDRVLASGQGESSWERPGWCSLVGRVAQTEGEVDGIRVGDRVGAIGPVASSVVLPAQKCLVMPDSVDTDRAAHWALLVALVRSVRRLRIEIGESVLVLGGGLVGNLIAQLSLAAGAALVVGLDYKQGTSDDEFETHNSVLAPRWVTDQDSLQKALPDGEADVLIDTLGDFERLQSTLRMVRIGGRAWLLAVKNAHPVDFDFYPDIHRRSLTVMSSVLQTALSWNSQGEAGLIDHLIKRGRVSLAHPVAKCVHPGRSAERTVSVSGKSGLMLHWNG